MLSCHSSHHASRLVVHTFACLLSLIFPLLMDFSQLYLPYPPLHLCIDSFSPVAYYDPLRL